MTSLTGWKRSQAGFRADWIKDGHGLTVQRDAYTGALHQQGTRHISIAGANLLGRTTMRLAGGSELSAQAYWDFTERNQPNAFVEHLHTLDVQLQNFDDPCCIAPRRVIGALLGHQVSAAADGEERLRLFKPGEVDVLITDVNLPGMSGIELAGLLREASPSLRVIVASGAGMAHGEPGTAQYASLLKPYRVDQLQDILMGAAETQAS